MAATALPRSTRARRTKDGDKDATCRQSPAGLLGLGATRVTLVFRRRGRRHWRYQMRRIQVHPGAVSSFLTLGILGMSCGQGNGPASRSAVHPGAALVATSYTVGGTLSGISGTAVLQDNGGDDLSLSADGPFTFGTPLADGSTYAVSVLAQPQGQTCTVANGNGTISSANVTDVTVTCTPIVCAGWFTGYCMVDDRTGLLTGECWDPGNCFTGVSCYCQGDTLAPTVQTFCGPTVDSTFCIF